ncbi:MAG: hypothetical protein LBS82_02165 [Spirochaetaceae bacterium]|jgi:hypothetical protein|nr:hypothetical protein [Spirochaetaceae bacterium]
MFSNSPSAERSIPGEYKKAVADLFPIDFTLKPTLAAAEYYAKCLEVDADFTRLIESAADLEAFFPHFKKNFSLLVAKTWVEQADEIRKETLQLRLPGFYAKIEREDYRGALADFSVILEELAYLFFGDQSKKDDFTEYAFRIDAQMGLFWWYSSRLSHIPLDEDPRLLRALLILGICYLSAF